jgi:hypothetical protein
LKFKLPLIAIVCAVAFVNSCASVPKGENQILEFNISPEKGITAGTIVVVEVKTTDNIEKVYGSLDVPGSFRLPLKYDGIKQIWVFKAMIPVSLSVPKGEFTAVIEAVSKSGETYRKEKKISTY